MGVYDSSLGTLLVGSWANVILYVWELTQVYRYIDNYPYDRLLFKITVASTLLFDTVATIVAFAFVYLEIVVHWGDLEYLAIQPWAQLLGTAANAVSAALTQIFLVHRYWSLTGHKAISIVILALVVMSMAGALACVVIAVISPDITLRIALEWSSIMWLVLSVLADTITAAALSIQFIRVDAYHKSTRRLMRRLVALTIQTGTITAVWATSMLVIFLVFPEDNYSVTLGVCMGRIYALTLLFNLNIRRRLRGHDTMIDAQSICLDDARPVDELNTGNESS